MPNVDRVTENTFGQKLTSKIVGRTTENLPSGVQDGIFFVFLLKVQIGSYLILVHFNKKSLLFQKK